MAEATARLAPPSIGRALRLTQDQLQAALDPRNFVEIRTIPGGPGALQPVFTDTEQQEAGVTAWLTAKETLLSNYRDNLRKLSKAAAQ